MYIKVDGTSDVHAAIVYLDWNHDDYRSNKSINFWLLMCIDQSHIVRHLIINGLFSICCLCSVIWLRTGLPTSNIILSIMYTARVLQLIIYNHSIKIKKITWASTSSQICKPRLALTLKHLSNQVAQYTNIHQLADIFSKTSSISKHPSILGSGHTYIGYFNL